MFRLVPLFASITIAASAHAACSAQSGKDSPHLVELYTSEGCSSCPPAEKWMSSLVPKPGFVGLEFHVDYWDSPAWRDPFDSKSYTQRQETLDKSVKGAQPYTPQIWLDGQLWNNWPKGAPPTPYSGPQPGLQVEASVADSIKAHVTTTGVAAGQRLYVALTENGLGEIVRGGENKGKTLAHDQVVRAFAGPFDQSQVDVELKLPEKNDIAKSSIVAFVQKENGGEVSQVVKLPLNQCTR
jgi:hypothetical protein